MNGKKSRQWLIFKTACHVREGFTDIFGVYKVHLIWCSVHGVWKLRINIAGKDAVLTENKMFCDNSRLFSDINEIE